MMCPGSAEWWLDHKGTKNPEVVECSTTMSLHSIQSTWCEMQSMSPLRSSGCMLPRKIWLNPFHRPNIISLKCNVIKYIYSFTIKVKTHVYFT